MVQSKQDKWLEVAAYAIMSIVMLIILFPFVLLFMSSITEETSLLVNGYSIFPKDISFRSCVLFHIKCSSLQGLENPEPSGQLRYRSCHAHREFLLCVYSAEG